MQSILSSLKQSVNIIKKNKSSVLILLIIQLLFFGILSFSASKTLVPALTSFVDIREYMDNIDLNKVDPESPFTSGMLGDDPLMIYNNAKQIVAYSITFIITFLLSFALINGTSWYLTNKLINKKTKFLPYILNFALISVIYLLLFGLILFNLSKNIVFGLSSIVYLLALILLILLALITYFSFIALAFSDKELKQIPKKAFSLSIKKPSTLITTFLISIAIKIILFTIISFILEMNFWLLVFVLLILTFSFVFARIFFNVVVAKN